jgi:hypothetical protein
MPVTRRAGVGSGAARTDLQTARRQDRRDAAAAGPDGVDVDDRDLQWEGADLRILGNFRLALSHQTNVRAGATDVYGDDVGKSRRVGHAHGADDSRSGARKGRVDGLSSGGFGTSDAAIRFHNEQGAVDLALI